jgi:precorrin-3B methylase
MVRKVSAPRYGFDNPCDRRQRDQMRIANAPIHSASGAEVCTVSGANGQTVNYAAAGSCVIDANEAGNAGYTAAPQVTATITANQAPAFVLTAPR